MNQDLHEREAFHLTLNNPSFLRGSKKPSRISIGNLGFQHFFDIKDNWKKTSIIFFLAIIMGFLNFFLIERSGIYNPGINSLFQSFARSIFVFTKPLMSETTSSIIYSFLFWGLNIFFNLFCAIFCYKKIGKKFTQLTFLYICVSALTGLTLSNLPTSWGFKDFYVFSDPKSHETFLSENNIKLLLWPMEGVTKSTDHHKVLIIFIYAFIYAIINTFISLIVYSLDAGTGGVDWIVFYLYKTKSSSSAKLLFYTGIIFSIISYLLGTYLPYLIKNTSNKQFKNVLPNLISPTFLSTLIIIFTKKSLFNHYYPQFKFVKTTVFTNKYLDIRGMLIKQHFPHSFTITHSIGSFQLRNQTQLEFICLAIELKELMENIRTVDPDCLIVATTIKTLNGKIRINK